MSLNVKISSFSYDVGEVLRDLEFSLEKGEHLAVLGESGCGKSTLLHLIYGLLELKNGAIKWKGNTLRGPNYKLIPGEDFIKLVAQEFRLTPFTTVKENITEHLSGNHPKKEADRVLSLLEVVGMTNYRDRKIDLLSGGQKQRVALAKALALRPELLLLDEPFSHIDTFKKKRLRRELYSFLKTQGISCITATHDAEEALAYADSILILREGLPVAYGRPQEVYNHPVSAYVAGFFDNFSLIPSGLFNNPEPLLCYPHQLQPATKKTDLMVKVTECFFKGRYYLIRARGSEGWYYFLQPEPIKKGTEVYLTVKPGTGC